jgi:pilus assembly protein Flp/PilA
VGHSEAPLSREERNVLNLYLNIINWLKSEEGQDLAEYALLLGLIAVVVMVAVMALGNSLLGFFNTLSAAVAAWAGGGTS